MKRLLSLLARHLQRTFSSALVCYKHSYAARHVVYYLHTWLNKKVNSCVTRQIAKQLATKLVRCSA